MTTKYVANNDHYVSQQTRDKLRRLLRQNELTIVSLAYQLRMSRTYVSAMLGGSQKMAHVHLLAIQMVLLKHTAARKAKDRQSLTPEIPI